MQRIASCEVSLPEKHTFPLSAEHSRHHLDSRAPLHQRLFILLHLLYCLSGEFQRALPMHHRDDQNVSIDELTLRTGQIRVFSHSEHHIPELRQRHDEVLLHIGRREAEPAGAPRSVRSVPSVPRVLFCAHPFARIRRRLRALGGIEGGIGGEGVALPALRVGHLRGRRHAQRVQPLAAFVGARADGTQTHQPRNGAIAVAVGHALVEGVLDGRMEEKAPWRPRSGSEDAPSAALG